MKDVLVAGSVFLFAVILTIFITAVECAMTWQFWAGMALMALIVGTA